jgi:hypothetical protein
MPLTPTELVSEINAQLPTNGIGQISAAELRQVLIDIVNNQTGTGGGGTFSGTGDPGLTATQIEATTFTTPPDVINTSGYSSPGDSGGGQYVRVGTTPPAHPAYKRSLDGTYYELRPVGNKLNIAQYGAIPMIDTFTQPVYGAADDAYPAFVKADKHIKALNLKGVTLQIPVKANLATAWFVSHPVQAKRAVYHIEGGGMNECFIRYPAYSDAFVTNYTYSCGRDFTIFAASSPVVVGMYLWKTNLQLNPGGVYVCVAGGNLAASGDPLTGTDPTATYTHGAAQFKYVMNVGPGSEYDYDITSTNFAEGFKYSNFTTWSFWDPHPGAPVENKKFPDQNLDISGTSIYNCGLILRAKAELTRIQVLSANGFGIGFLANGDPEIKGAGNVNQWNYNHVRTIGCGKAGIHTGNSDCNASSGVMFEDYYAGRFGIEEFSFLGNNHAHMSFQYSGSSISPYRQYPSGCSYNGFGWLARLPILGIETKPGYVGTEPGVVPGGGVGNPWIRYFIAAGSIGARITGSISGNTLTVSAVTSGAVAVNQTIASNESITSGRVRPGTKITSGSGTTWTVDGAAQTVASGAMNLMSMTGTGGADYPDWTPTKIFEPGGGYGSNSVNARNTILGAYHEGGTAPSQPGPRDLILGGLQQGDVDRTRGALIVDDNKWNYLTAYGLRTSPGGGAPSGGTNFTSFVTLGGNGDAQETILQLINYEGHTWALQHINGTGADGVDSRDIVFRDNTGPGKNVLTFTGHNTTKLYGGSAGNTLPSSVFINDLIIGSGTAAEDGRPVYMVGQAPTSGYHRKGTLFINDGSVSTATGQPAMWSCTAEGSPGTFKIIAVFP